MRDLPTKILRDLLQQRGKHTESWPDPYTATFLRFMKNKRQNRDFLYRELSDRNRRMEILHMIYSEKDIVFSNGARIPAAENLRSLYSSTFEWYVAELLYREFSFFASAFGLKIANSPEGGDFDVIGATHTGLIAIECKSGKPRGIDENQIIQFVRRHHFLRADYSIFYIDYKGLEGNFPFKFFAHAVHGAVEDPKVFKVVVSNGESNANFYLVEGANIYVVDNSKSTGNVIRNLRFAIDTHYALKASQNRFMHFDPDLLKSIYQLDIELV